MGVLWFSLKVLGRFGTFSKNFTTNMLKKTEGVGREVKK